MKRKSVPVYLAGIVGVGNQAVTLPNRIGSASTYSGAARVAGKMCPRDKHAVVTVVGGAFHVRFELDSQWRIPLKPSGYPDVQEEVPTGEGQFTLETQHTCNACQRTVMLLPSRWRRIELKRGGSGAGFLAVLWVCADCWNGAGPGPGFLYIAIQGGEKFTACYAGPKR